MSIHRVAGRRAFLAGGAAIVALPFLESIELRTASAQAMPSPRRLLYYYVPNGIHMATFKPTAAGTAYPMPAMLMPLDALRSDFTVVTGLENAPAKPDGPGDHASGTAGFITCAHAFKSETTIQLGISADQVAAKAIGSATRITSMQIGLAGGSTAGNCDSGYGCAYARNISWSDATTPLPKLVDPVKVFDQIFAGVNPTESAAAAAKRRAYDKSVLDAITSDAKGLGLKLGRTDNVKLEQYLTSVRALETKLMAMTPVSQCTPGTKPPATSDFPTKLTLMSDLMVLAMQCDATRIISFMLGNAGSGQTHPHLGITGGHHDISHHASDATKLSQLATIGLWEITQLAYLLNKMKSVTEGADGSSNMLYNSTVFFSSEISDGNRHNHDDMPIILAGHGGGALQPGKHLSFPTNMKQKVANLLVTMLGTAGVANATLGDSTGPLAGL